MKDEEIIRNYHSIPQGVDKVVFKLISVVNVRLVLELRT